MRGGHGRKANVENGIRVTRANSDVRESNNSGKIVILINIVVK